MRNYVHPVYPYKVSMATTISFASFQPYCTDSSLVEISEDASLIDTALNEKSLPSNTIQKICTITRVFNANSPLHIKGTGNHIPQEKAGFIRNSIDIIPSSNNQKIVFVSLHQPLQAHPGGQGLRFKKIIMLTFDASGRFVADSVKRIISIATPFKDSDEKFMEIIRRISIMQKLETSPYFPKNYAFVQNVGKKGPKLRIFQEQASRDLHDYLENPKRKQVLSTTCQLMIARNLIGALKDMEDAGYTHRDLKLDNVLAFADQHNELVDVKLTDLGLACSLSDTAQLERLSGSLPWACPEILQQALFNVPIQATLDIKADVWSLGLFLYYISENCVSLLHRHIFTLLEIFANSNDIHYAYGALISNKSLKIRENAALINILNELSIPLDEPIDAILQHLQAKNKEIVESKKATLLNIQTELKNLPARPNKIVSLKDLALSMLQLKSSDRLSLQNALLALPEVEHALSPKTANNSSEDLCQAQELICTVAEENTSSEGSAKVEVSHDGLGTKLA